MTGSLDTNTLLQLTIEDKPEKTRLAEELLANGNCFQLADAVLFEMVFVLEKIYKLDRERIARNIYTIIRHPKINSNRKLFELVLPYYIQNPKLTIIDCALVEYALLNKALPLHTFDEALAKVHSNNVKLLKQYA